MDQPEFFFTPKKAEPKSPTKPAPKKPFFTSATLINGLEKAMVMDHAMLWVRSLTKTSKNNPKDFLAHQSHEIMFKQSGVDPVAVIRQSIVLDKTGKQHT